MIFKIKLKRKKEKNYIPPKVKPKKYEKKILQKLATKDLFG